MKPCPALRTEFLQAALQYHAEGLTVIPIRENQKVPAVEAMGGTWEQYQNRISTEQEITHWWQNGYDQTFNIGLVHGKLDNGFTYATLDIDHDNGLMTQLVNDHDYLFNGRIEQSGSGQGFHFPLLLETVPDWGYDQKQNRLRGNKTWKTSLGVLNCRIFGCQTVAPPSIHPNGQPYKFIQTGEILKLNNLDSLIEWLNKLTATNIILPKRVITSTQDDLVAQVEGYWDCMKVFEHFGKASSPRTEVNGEIRLLGNGGLLVTSDLRHFYIFSDDFGGSIFEAWGYCRVGSSYDKHVHFYPILLEMAKAAGIKLAPLDIPDGDLIIIVAGEEKAEVLKAAGFSAVGLPGNVFKRAWTRLFDKKSTVYVMLGPGKEQSARAIANEFRASGLTSYTCDIPVTPDEYFNYGGTPEGFNKHLELRRKLDL